MKTRFLPVLSAVLALAAVALIPSLTAASGSRPRQNATRNSAANRTEKARITYAIVVPAGHSELDAAVQALRAKQTRHGREVKVITYKDDVREALPGLREALPYYTCFVTPKELVNKAIAANLARTNLPVSIVFNSTMDYIHIEHRQNSHMR